MLSVSTGLQDDEGEMTGLIIALSPSYRGVSLRNGFELMIKSSCSNLHLPYTAHHSPAPCLLYLKKIELVAVTVYSSDEWSAHV
ncbi:unnamed protein product [Nippostrongylus brasiliensis]|uniref:Uncharacterized protein n=1 Tax=Nippostrongylus brasiliensis TaxID=27835 RepID=A0A0N4YYZ5_NIPBR|nr:unnamed protein product [Nippostrongylus brasiliensis]